MARRLCGRCGCWDDAAAHDCLDTLVSLARDPSAADIDGIADALDDRDFTAERYVADAFWATTHPTACEVAGCTGELAYRIFSGRLGDPFARTAGICQWHGDHGWGRHQDDPNAAWAISEMLARKPLASPSSSEASST